MAAVSHLAIVVCVRTTYEGDLVVFITVQNLVGVGAVVLIDICVFFGFASLAGKRLYSRLQNCFFGGVDPLNGEPYQRDPQKAHP